MGENEPSFTVTIPEGRSYVLIIFNEPMTREMTVMYLKELKILGEKLSSPRFLFDARKAPNKRSTIQDYEIYDFSSVFGFPGARIAVIISPDDRSYDFTDIVVNNAGYIHRLFTDEKEAVEWIES